MGLGFMGATHVKAFKNVPNARIAALCNPSGRNLDGDFSNVGGNIGTKEPLKLDMANVAAYQDFDELLKNPNIDLIDICTPTTTHEELAIRALAAGKHVLLEKPMARTAESARRIVEAAEKASTLLMPAMCLRFWPHWRYVKEVVADGRFGKVLSARFRRVAEPQAGERITTCPGINPGEPCWTCTSMTRILSSTALGNRSPFFQPGTARSPAQWIT